MAWKRAALILLTAMLIVSALPASTAKGTPSSSSLHVASSETKHVGNLIRVDRLS